MRHARALSIVTLCSMAVTALALAAQEQERFKDLRPPAPLEDGLTARLDQLEQHACAKCHADVFAEWSRTLHALAWVSEPYQEEIAGKAKPQGCWGCHVPVRLLDTDLSAKPDPRLDTRHYGVDCIACHQSADGKVHGPWGEPTDAHVSVRDPRFEGSGSNGLCAACHRTNIGPVIGIAKDFEEDGQSCLACHMAPLERTLADGKTVRAGRSHALQTPRDPSFLARAFAIGLEMRAERAFVVIENVAGHRLPGLVGRKFVFDVRCFNVKGVELAPVQLKIDTRSSLAHKAKIEIELPAGSFSARLSASHVDPRQAEPRVFLERELR